MSDNKRIGRLSTCSPLVAGSCRGLQAQGDPRALLLIGRKIKTKCVCLRNGCVHQRSGLAL